MNKRTDILDKVVIDDYQKKQLSTYKQAEIHGADPETIRKRLIKNNVGRRQRKVNLPDDQIVILYVLKNKTTYEIRDILKADYNLDVNHKTVGRRLKKYGIRLQQGEKSVLEIMITHGFKDNDFTALGSVIISYNPWNESNTTQPSPQSEVKGLVTIS